MSLFPIATTVGQGLFDGASSNGARQGSAYPDPATRFALRGGILASSETLPMWGGLGVYMDIPGASGGYNPALGCVMGRATAATGSKPLAGFAVFDQAYGMVNAPNSQVPLAYAGQQVMAYAFGSRARIWLAADPGLVDLYGDPISSQVAYDYVNGLVIPYTGNAAASAGTYNNTSGVVSLTAAGVNLSPGDTVTVSGATGTGTVSDIDGTFTCTAGTGAGVVNYEIATGLTLTITGATVTTGPALPVTILEILNTNCMTVEYDAVNKVANWDFNGACILLQI